MLRSTLLSSVSVFNLPRAPGDEGAPAADPPANQDADESRDPGAAAAPPAADPSAAAGEGEGDEPAAPAADAQDWRDREIRRKHAQNQQLKRDRDELSRQQDELRRENEELRAIAARVPPKDGEAPAPVASKAPAAPTVDRDAVREEAARLNAKEKYDADCNATYRTGKQTYGDKWDVAIDRLVTLGNMDVDTMVAILATDDPAKVMFDLGANPDEYHRVMELPPARRNTELVKLGLKPAAKTAPKKMSDAPAPVEPVQGRGVRSGDGLDDDVDDETWFTRRRAQKAEKWKNDRAAGRV